MSQGRGNKDYEYEYNKEFNLNTFSNILNYLTYYYDVHNTYRPNKTTEIKLWFQVLLLIMNSDLAKRKLKI